MNRIIVIEPQCRGFAHARFNAALLATIGAAYPDGEIDFVSEREHAGQVSLLASGVLPESVRLCNVDGRSTWPRNSWLRMLAEYRFCTRVLARFRERRADMLLFSSVSAQTLIAVKRLLLQEPTSGVVIAIPHSVLGGLDCPSRRVWNRPLSIGNALKLPVPPSLRCLALSRTILSAVTASHGAAGWRHMHLPCIFDAQQARFDETVTRAVFGFFGALREEMAQYCALVENVTRKVPDAAFVLVGHCLSGGSYAERLARHVTGVGDTPISDTEYQRRARTVTHAVFLLPASHYRYKSSTGIMDAFNYQKPIICLKNPLLDEYAASMGDLGYAPSTLQELEDVVASLAQALPTSRYSRQVTAIIRGRDQFSPKALSTAFRLAVEK